MISISASESWVDGAGTPLVSVLTPSFNQAAWLSDNLQSVACQTYPEVEHIVMDGGSTDGSVKLLEAARDAVRWRSEPDRGQADALNKAFFESRGEIIGWINSDDAYFDCRVIGDVVAYFSENPAVDVVYGHCAQTTADGLFIQLLWSPAFDGELLRTVNIISQPAAFFRRSAIERCPSPGGALLDDSFDFTMDYDLWLRLEAAGCRFKRMGRITAIDRHQEARKSSTIKDVHERNLKMLAARYDTRFGPEHDDTRTAFYRKQRIAGALLIPKVRPPFAFATPERPKRGLLRRQIGSRRSQWPQEYR